MTQRIRQYSKSDRYRTNWTSNSVKELVGRKIYDGFAGAEPWPAYAPIYRNWGTNFSVRKPTRAANPSGFGADEDGPDAASDNLSTTMCTDTRSDPEPSYSPHDNMYLRPQSSTERLDEFEKVVDQQFETLDKLLIDEFSDIENKHQELGEDLSRRLEAIGQRLDRMDQRFGQIIDMLKAAASSSKGLNYQPSRMNTTRTIGGK